MTQEAAAEGLVLRLAQFGESDRMASLLMADGSRRELRVPQARASRKRFGGFDVYVKLRCAFVPDRRGRPRLESIDVLAAHEGLRDELHRSALAAHVAELLLQASQEDHPLPDLYRLALAALDALNRGAADGGPRGWARGFELKLLHVLGLRPSLLRCAVSGRSLPPGEALRWSTTHGGALGPDGPTDARSLVVTLGTLRAMHASLRTPLGSQAEVSWSPEATHQAEEVLRDFLFAHLGRREKARRFLAEVLGPSLAAGIGLALLGSGCVAYTPPELVRVQGYLYESPEPVAGDIPVSGASAMALGSDGALVVEGGEPFSDTPGWYRFTGLPPSTLHHHLFAPPQSDGGHVATVLPGSSATDDLYVDAGAFHLWPRATVDGWLLPWQGAEGLPTFDPGTEDGGLLRGVVQAPVLGQRLAVVLDDGSLREAVSPDAQAGGLGPSGEFFVFDLPVGAATLTLLDAEDSPQPDGLPLWVVEDAVTSLTQLNLAP